MSKKRHKNKKDMNKKTPYKGKWKTIIPYKKMDQMPDIRS